MTNENENTQGTPAPETAAAPVKRTMSDEAKAKQAASMRARWQDETYKANVAAGRAAKKAAKAAAGEQVVKTTDAN